ncbi:MAG: exodeoxyribonuclease VII large subunit [Bacteroidetes bacterium]|nr:exodeoxyribonuclease VII large subunit [Bacteroidota bacterium]
MPDKLNDRTIFSLLEVARSIQKTMADRYTSSFWIKAEMNKLNHYPQSGHCYPDLVEKTDGKIVAEMRSIIWKDDFQRINDNFLNVLHEQLKSGSKILFCAKVSYNPVYGLSLRILDIDPSWSLGELEKEKQQTIEKLRKEGIFNTNRSLTLPLLPRRIAIVSVETSKGYADFCKIIDGNSWGYAFFYMLFPALLQGENAVHSILNQLERISSVQDHFDAVAIIRGGGGDVGLTCYNNYELAKAIALFPLPVITGIGHSTNETVAEMVAFTNAITPSELADYLIQKFHNFSVPLKNAQDTIVNKMTRLLLDEQAKILNTARYFKSVSLSRLAQSRNEIQQEGKALKQQSVYFFQRKQEQYLGQQVSLYSRSINFIQVQLKDITNVERNIKLLDPANILKRGYSITLVNGKTLKTVGDAGEGTILQTILADGNIFSTAQSVNKTKNNDERA